MPLYGNIPDTNLVLQGAQKPQGHLGAAEHKHSKFPRTSKNKKVLTNAIQCI